VAVLVTVTATSSRFLAKALASTSVPVVAAALVAAALAAAGCSSSPAVNHADGPPGKVPSIHLVAAAPAPAGWHVVRLPDGNAAMAYPPDMHSIDGDRGTVAAARFSSSGGWLLYLNSTPKQGDETLSDWPDFRVEHLTDEDASTARLLAASHGVRFLGGRGTCVVDTYITRLKAHHYTELACYVEGKTSSSVIIAAARAADWNRESGMLMRAVAAYRVR
jgi:hypothetical protein